MSPINTVTSFKCNCVMITGSSGFIGTNLMQHLQKEFPDVKVLLVDDRDPRVPVVSPNHHHMSFDLLGSVSVLTGLMRDHAVDMVFHFAANSDIAAAAERPTVDFQSTQITQNVLEAMRMAGVRQLIYMSGSGVYGDKPNEVLTESSALEPVSPYGASKVACEALIRAYSAMFDIRARVFRGANIVGPWQTHGVGYDFLHRLTTDPTALFVRGDGRQAKSYLHVSDLLRAFFRVLGGAAQYEVFNVATEDTMTVRQIAQAVIDMLKLSPQTPVHYGESPRGWPGDVPRVQFSIDALKRTGWYPQYPTSATAMSLSLVQLIDNYDL